MFNSLPKYGKIELENTFRNKEVPLKLRTKLINYLIKEKRYTPDQARRETDGQIKLKKQFVEVFKDKSKSYYVKLKEYKRLGFDYRQIKEFEDKFFKKSDNIPNHQKSLSQLEQERKEIKRKINLNLLEDRRKREKEGDIGGYGFWREKYNPNKGKSFASQIGKVGQISSSSNNYGKNNNLNNLKNTDMNISGKGIKPIGF